MGVALMLLAERLLRAFNGELRIPSKLDCSCMHTSGKESMPSLWTGAPWL
jgi:hypothetical protein